MSGFDTKSENEGTEVPPVTSNGNSKTRNGSFLQYMASSGAYLSSSTAAAANATGSFVKCGVATVAGAVIGTVDYTLDAVSPTDPFVRLRPSWNVVFGAAVKTLRIAAHNVSHDVGSIRMLTDHGIPTVLLPSGMSSHKSQVPPGEWTYLTSTNFKHTESLDNTAVILYFHGGAFCCCGSNTHRGLLYRLARATEAIIFAVDYRRPPEFPFPCPVDDCIAAYRYLLFDRGVEANRIIFAGDSAGGSLVAAVSIEAKRLGLPSPAGGLMMSPWVDLADVGITDSWTRNEAFDYLPQDLARYFASMYMGSTADDEMVSPIYSTRLQDLPPLHIELGQCEVLHDQIMAFALKARAHGVSVDVNVREDMIHVFCLFAVSGLLQCESAFESMAMFVRARTRLALRGNKLDATPLLVDIDGTGCVVVEEAEAGEGLGLGATDVPLSPDDDDESHGL